MTTTRSQWPLALCPVPHPDHPDVTCYRSKNHTGAHHGIHPSGDYETWGLGVMNVVSIVEHHGNKYIMLDDGHFGCCYVADRGGAQSGQADWRFHLWGLHAGPTLDVWLCNVRLEYDDDGPSSCAQWGPMLWADDGTPVEDGAILDGYCDALFPTVKEMLQEAQD